MNFRIIAGGEWPKQFEQYTLQWWFRNYDFNYHWKSLIIDWYHGPSTPSTTGWEREWLSWVSHICSKRRLTVMVVSCFACFVSCLDQVSLVIALITHIRALLWCHLSSQTAGCVFVLESGLLLSAYELDLEMPDSLTTSRPPHLWLGGRQQSPLERR